MKVIHSELSMRIVPGSNFDHIDEEIDVLLDTKIASYKFVAKHGTQYVVARYNGKWQSVYYLVDSTIDLQHALTNALKIKSPALMRSVVNNVIGCVQIEHGPLDEIDTVWVAPQFVGKGYGEGLHRLAYQQSKRGIQSSVNLGTQSLMTLIRLYQKEPKIQLVYDDATVNRSEVVIKGHEIWWNKRNLCDPKAKEFWFEWHK
jgi:hypothetical protein